MLDLIFIVEVVVDLVVRVEMPWSDHYALNVQLSIPANPYLGKEWIYAHL